MACRRWPLALYLCANYILYASRKVNRSHTSRNLITSLGPFPRDHDWNIWYLHIARGRSPRSFKHRIFLTSNT